MLSLILLLTILGCDCKSKKPVEKRAAKTVRETTHGHFHSKYENGVNTRKTSASPKTAKQSAKPRRTCRHSY